MTTAGAAHRHGTTHRGRIALALLLAALTGVMPTTLLARPSCCERTGSCCREGLSPLGGAGSVAAALPACCREIRTRQTPTEPLRPPLNMSSLAVPPVGPAIEAQLQPMLRAPSEAAQVRHDPPPSSRLSRAPPLA